MIALLAAAQAIVDQGLRALETEAKLLELGFTDIEFPRRGPQVRAKYLGILYDFD